VRKLLLQRLFLAFPGGCQGIALLLLRAVLALSLLIQGGYYLRGATGALSWFVGLAAIACGALTLIGFLTPIAAALAGLGAVGIGISLLPACTPTVFDSKPAVVFAGIILVEIILLGPGAFSLDARAFGRRQIIIPPSVSPSRRLPD
jgi:uncharacterized membrane protein YphA (DoxX/SURF4 family)